ncbi:MFS transporter [Streptomyces sp. NRRL F-5123]|uniref:MFS transporter n=1 Tax=Streptomyces sp. NRRL F-5123 TaxID=1463856 RepID=UPI0004E24D85|nr:MFS transporter [Streptomyces sp. NRRL F-5123]
MADETTDVLRAGTEQDGAAARRAETRTLRLLVVSSMLTKVGDWQLGIVVPLAVLSRTHSPALSLISIALRGVAYAVSPLVGSLIDRFDRRFVLVLSQVQQALCLALMSVLFSSQVAILLLVFLSGIGGVASTITGQFVLLPKLIGPARRPVAVAKLSSSIEYAKVIGLVLGGAAFSAHGAVFACLCIVALYGASGLVATALPAVPSERHTSTLSADLAIGFRWLVKPEILWLVVTMAVVNLAIGELEAALITQFADEDLAALVISFVLALGLLLGALASRFAPHVLPSWSLESRLLLLQAVAFPSLVLLATPVAACKAVGYMVVCVAVGMSNVMSITYRQESIPVELAGRVNATIRMFITGSVPLSGFIFAAASHLSGYRFWLPSAVMWAAAIAIWGGYTMRVRQEPAPAEQ